MNNLFSDPIVSRTARRVKTESSKVQQAQQVKSMLSGLNPESLKQQLMQSNPQFADFVRKNANKSIDQIAKDYGLDHSVVSNLLK